VHYRVAVLRVYKPSWIVTVFLLRENRAIYKPSQNENNVSVELDRGLSIICFPDQIRYRKFRGINASRDGLQRKLFICRLHDVHTQVDAEISKILRHKTIKSLSILQYQNPIVVTLRWHY